MEIISLANLIIEVIEDEKKFEYNTKNTCISNDDLNEIIEMLEEQDSEKYVVITKGDLVTIQLRVKEEITIEEYDGEYDVVSNKYEYDENGEFEYTSEHLGTFKSEKRAINKAKKFGYIV